MNNERSTLVHVPLFFLLRRNYKKLLEKDEDGSTFIHLCGFFSHLRNTAFIFLNVLNCKNNSTSIFRMHVKQ